MALMTLYVEAPRSAARIKHGKSVLFGNSVSRSYREQFLFFFLSRFVPFFSFPLPLFLFLFAFFDFLSLCLQVEVMRNVIRTCFNYWICSVDSVYDNFNNRSFKCDIEICSFEILVREKLFLFFFLDISYYIFSFMLEARLCSSIIIEKFMFILNMKYNDNY